MNKLEAKKHLALAKESTLQEIVSIIRDMRINSVKLKASPELTIRDQIKELTLLNRCSLELASDISNLINYLNVEAIEEARKN